jgi:hypothetical protein
LRMGQMALRKAWEFDPDYDVLRRDVEFLNSGSTRYVRLLIKRGKVDKWNKGGARFLMAASDDSEFCPLKFFEAYFKASMHLPAGEPLFRHADGSNVTMPQVSRCIKRHATKLGLDPEFYASHSIRIGGATALRAQGVSMSDIMQHGGWTTQEGCLRYLQLTQGTAMNLSRALHLAPVEAVSPVLAQSRQQVMVNMADLNRALQARSGLIVREAGNVEDSQQVVLPTRVRLRS